MVSRLKQNGIAFVLAVLLHIIIFFILMMSVAYYFQNQHEITNQGKEPSPAIQAVAVDQAAIEKLVAKLQAKKEEKEEQAQREQIAKEQAQAEQQAQEEVFENLRISKEMHQARLQAQILLAKQQMDELNKLQKEAQKPVNVSQNSAPAQPPKKIEESALAQQQMLNEFARYKAMILNAVGKQWIIPPGVDRALSCQLLIKLDAEGKVQNVEVLRSSGNELLDQSAVMAVLKASPLPLPQNPLLLEQFRELQLTVKPEGLLNNS